MVRGNNAKDKSAKDMGEIGKKCNRQDKKSFPMGSAGSSDLWDLESKKDKVLWQERVPLPHMII